MLDQTPVGDDFPFLYLTLCAYLHQGPGKPIVINVEDMSLSSPTVLTVITSGIECIKATRTTAIHSRPTPENPRLSQELVSRLVTPSTSHHPEVLGQADSFRPRQSARKRRWNGSYKELFFNSSSDSDGSDDY
jgi:hypothetical protein